MLLVLSSLTPLQTSAADDLTGHTYEKQIRELMELGIITGYKDGTVKPEREVTRAEFARMVVKTFELETQLEATEFTSAAAETIDFKDVQAGAWFAPSVLDAVKAGITVGYPDNTFRPNELISREQMASMVSRALTAKGVLTDTDTIPALSFTDASSIADYSKEEVRILTHLGIMKGNMDNTFAPKDNSKRWMVAVVMLKAREIIFPPVPLEFQASSIDADSTTVLKHFDTFAEAKAYVQNNANADVVERSKQIVWMKNGLAVTNAYTEVYPTADLRWGSGTRASQFKPYLTTNIELKYLDATDTYVKVELAGKVGYVKPTVVTMIPSKMMKGRSYYTKSGENMVHVQFRHTTGSYTGQSIVGKAPKEFVDGVKYYSWDGSIFTDVNEKKVVEAHQYFNKLHLRTKTNYTAEELDKYFAEAFPFYDKFSQGVKWDHSPLIGSGAYFKEVEEQYEVNALYLVAHAVHESAWGTSKIARDKKNLFGYGAVDGDAYEKAYTYDTFKGSIEDAAKRVSQNYQSVDGSYYNGSFLGNKSLGMNVRYASDPYWGQGIAAQMYVADKKLGSKDIGSVKLGYVSSTSDFLNFRKDATTNYAALYTLPENGLIVAINGEVISGGATWYKVLSEQRAFKEAYAHGAYIKLLPLAE